MSSKRSLAGYTGVGVDIVAAGILILAPSDKKPVGWILLFLGSSLLLWIAFQWFRSNFRFVSPIQRRAGKPVEQKEPVTTAERPSDRQKDFEKDPMKWIRVMDGEPTRERTFIREHPVDVWRAVTDYSVSSIERESRVKKYVGKWYKLDSEIIDVIEPNWRNESVAQLRVFDAFIMTAEFDKTAYGAHLRDLKPHDRIRFIGRIETIEPPLEFVLVDCEPR